MDVGTMKRRHALIAGGTLAVAGVGAAYAGRLRTGTMAGYNRAAAAMRDGPPAHPTMRECVRYATLAPSGHNTQPWRFRIAANRIEILPDLLRRTPVVDPDDHHLFISLGCAAENLAIAAAAQGCPGTLSINPAGSGSVVLTFGDGPSAAPGLSAAIPQSRSARTEYDGKPVDAADLRRLAGAAVVPGVDLAFITDQPRIERVLSLIVEGNSAQLADAAFMRELKSWLRFSPRQAMESGDGLFSAASGSPALPAWLGSALFDLMFKAGAENDKYARQMRSSAGVAVFAGQRADRDHWVRVGQACQRFALQATALGIQHAFVNQPVEVPRLRPELAGMIGLPGRRPDIVMRFGYGPTLPFSPRRQLAAVLA